jgi:hypothetical protein
VLQRCALVRVDAEEWCQQVTNSAVYSDVICIYHTKHNRSGLQVSDAVLS